MHKEKRGLLSWIKDHKKQLFFAGISVTALIAAVLLLKNRKAVENAWESLINTISNKDTLAEYNLANKWCVHELEPIKETVEIVETATRTAHDVPTHLRNLPIGWKASTEKITTALEHGYVLLEGQTWVEAYSTGSAAA